MEALGRLAHTGADLIGQAAGFVVMVVVGWRFLMLIFSGGSERALASLLKTLLVFGVAIAAIANLQGVVALLGTVGTTILDAALTAVNGAL